MSHSIFENMVAMGPITIMPQPQVSSVKANFDAIMASDLINALISVIRARPAQDILHGRPEYRRLVSGAPGAAALVEQQIRWHNFPQERRMCTHHTDKGADIFACALLEPKTHKQTPPPPNRRGSRQNDDTAAAVQKYVRRDRKNENDLCDEGSLRLPPSVEGRCGDADRIFVCPRCVCQHSGGHERERVFRLFVVLNTGSDRRSMVCDLLYGRFCFQL